MRFQSANEFFLRDLRSKCRSLTGSALLARYKNDFQMQAQVRMSRVYETLDESFSQKAAFYTELFEIFGHLDCNFILWNIYFEEHSSLLFHHLAPTIKRYCESLIDNFFLHLIHQDAPVSNNDLIINSLKTNFVRHLSSDEVEWEDGTSQRNPVTEHFAKWIAACIQSNCDEDAVAQMILHYTKFWNIYYARPYSHSKGLILYHHFFKTYDQLSTESLKTNMANCIEMTIKELNKLFVPITHSPITDRNNQSFFHQLGDIALTTPQQKFLSRNIDFHRRMADSEVHFKDLKSVSWLDLVNVAIESQGDLKDAYLREHEKRIQSGRVPIAADILQFAEKVNKMADRPNDNAALEKVIRDNYIFFL